MEGRRRRPSCRRPRSAWVQRYLAHLRSHGFPEAPEPRGHDERGREVLEFLEGDVPEYPLPPFALTDHSLRAIGALVRRMHDASRGFEGAGVICHNDVAPYNTVYRDGVPAALIDWDRAAPGPPAWDLAHVAWRFVPLDPATPVSEAHRRIALILDAYDLTDRTGFIDTCAARAIHLHDTIRDHATAGDPGFTAMWKTEHSERPLADAAWMLTDLKGSGRRRGSCP
jgi:hypothetical protein